MIERYLERFHALDKLSGLVGIGFSNSTSSHEVLHRSHNVFSVLGWRGVTLDDAGKPVSDDKNLLDCVIAQLGRLASIHEVKGDEVAELCELSTECTSVGLVVLHLSPHTGAPGLPLRAGALGFPVLPSFGAGVGAAGFGAGVVGLPRLL